MSIIQNRTFNEIKMGDTASCQKTLTYKDIELFAIMSGDVNPAHVDPEYAKDDLFHKIIAHGMWGASMISTLLGTQLPGPGTIYLGQTLRFLHPIAIDDTITVSVTVIKKNPEKNILELDCQCLNQNGVTTITGIATVLAPTEKIKRQRVELPEIVFKEKHHGKPEK